MRSSQAFFFGAACALLAACNERPPDGATTPTQLVFPPWRMTVIDEHVGDHVAARIAADATGRLHVVYTANWSEVRYAVRGHDGEWTVEEVEGPSDSDTWAPAIALAGSRAPGGTSVAPLTWSAPTVTDLDAEVVLAWSRRDVAEMRLARGRSGAFAVSTLAKGTAPSLSSTDLEIDADGRAHVTWIDMTHPDDDDDRHGPLMHSFETASGVKTEVAAADAFDRGTDVALDDAGRARVLYYDPLAYEPSVAFLATQDASGTWSVEGVADYAHVGGLDPSLATDRSGTDHALWGGGDIAVYGTRSAGAWALETIETGPFAGVLSGLALDASGAPHGIWFVDGVLRYGVRSSQGWAVEPVTPFADGWVPPDIILDAAGAPSIVVNLTPDGDSAHGPTALVLLERDPG